VKNQCILFLILSESTSPVVQIAAPHHAQFGKFPTLEDKNAENLFRQSYPVEQAMAGEIPPIEPVHEEPVACLVVAT
jgi:hypothetical protein